MPTIYKTNNYESMMILTAQCSDTSSHLIAESYTKILKRLGAKNVDIHFMGQQTFAYTMNKVRTGRYITLSFTSSPRLLQIYEKRLKLDKNISRFRIFRS